MSTPQRRHLEVEDVGDVTVVKFTDSKVLSDHNVQVIGDQLFSLVDELGRNKLLLNFTQVEFLSSAVLGKLFMLHSKVRKAGGKLVVCGLTPTLTEPFKLTRLDTLVTICPDEQAGLESF